LCADTTRHPSSIPSCWATWSRLLMRPHTTPTLSR
jgi:hypothetical protein